LSTVAGAQPFARSFSSMSRRVAGARQAHTASITCSSAAESGFTLSGMPYILLFSLLSASFLLLHLSLFLHYTCFPVKVQEPEMPMESGFSGYILHLSLFLSFC
jgi:hypothetical protein